MTVKRKLVHIEVEGRCDNCLFREYDAFYSVSSDSGWDCTHPDCGKRIASDRDVTRHELDCIAIDKADKTLFPSGRPHPRHPMEIPDWCPLPDAVSENVKEK